MVQYVEEVQKNGNSIGGIIECISEGVPAGLGEPVFDKIKSRFASSILSIGGVLGFEYGAGFDTIALTGKTYNEGFENTDGKIGSKHNRYGGVLGGISTGEDIVFRVAVKPTSSIYTHQKNIDKDGSKVDFSDHGTVGPMYTPQCNTSHGIYESNRYTRYLSHRAK